MTRLEEDYFVKKETRPTTIKDKLDYGEKILWSGKPKKSSYSLSKTIKFMPIALIWGFIDISVLTILITAGAFADAPELIFFIVPFFILHLTPVWIWIGAIIKNASKMRNQFYYITTSRFLHAEGKEGRIIEQITTDELEKVSLHRDFIDKLLRVGDVTISGKNVTITMYDIPQSEFLYDKIYAISKSNFVNNTIFSNNITCEHCGSSYENTRNKCPYCGASKPRKHY